MGRERERERERERARGRKKGKRERERKKEGGRAGHVCERIRTEIDEPREQGDFKEEEQENDRMTKREAGRSEECAGMGAAAPTRVGETEK